MSESRRATARWCKRVTMAGNLNLLVCAVVLLVLQQVAVAGRGRKYYDILGVDPSADENTIKKAYRKQAL